MNLLAALKPAKCLSCNTVIAVMWIFLEVFSINARNIELCIFAKLLITLLIRA
jgi:hypothetical protein